MAEVMGHDVEQVLAPLRWGPDQQVINHEGERVWLKQVEHGITDCCPIGDPCDRHAGLVRAAETEATR